MATKSGGSLTAKVVHGLICLFGLAIHTYHISVQYFAYATVTAIKLNMPDNVTIPALSVCWRYADLLDIDALRRENAMIREIDFTSEETIKQTVRELQSRITLEQIFRYSPPTDRIYSSCIVRFPGNYDVTYMTAEQCRQRFEIERFYVQEYICYKATVKKLRNRQHFYNYIQTGSCLWYPGMAFQFGFDLKQFNGNQLVVPIVHSFESFPTTSIYFAPESKRFHSTDSIIPPFNYFYLTYMYLENTRLPYPYNTNCRHYETDQADCYKLCLINKTMNNLHKFPFTCIIRESDRQNLNFSNPIVDAQDLGNWRFKEKLGRYEQECTRQCSKKDCREELYITKLKKMDYFEGSISFRVNLPSNPNYFVAFHPNMQFFEYVTFVLSAMGTWLGISIYSVNPISFCVSLCAQEDQRSNSANQRKFRFRIELQLDYINTTLKYIKQELVLVKMRNNLR